MRHVKACFFLLLWCLLPLTAYAENKKIIIACTELDSIEIKQPQPGYPFPDEACGDTCFYLDLILQEVAAQKANSVFNAYKHCTREVYIGDHLLGIAEPFHIDAPYSQKLSSSKVHQTIEDALDEAREICPSTVITVPETIRH